MDLYHITSSYIFILDKIVVALVVFGGYYFASYFREKGKNLATKEDIDKITKATEAIKAEISSDTWVKQRRRELKLEAANTMNRQLAAFLVMELHRPRKASKAEAHMHDDLFLGSAGEMRARAEEAAEKWAEYETKRTQFTINWVALRGMVSVLFSRNANDSFSELDKYLRGELEVHPEAVPEFLQTRNRVLKMLLDEACA